LLKNLLKTKRMPSQESNLASFQKMIFSLPLVRFLYKILKSFNANYPNTSQNIQLFFIYCFAIVDLVYAVLMNVISLGYTPQVLLASFPLIEAILTSPFLRVWASPEKVFFLSFVVLEFMVVRSTFKFSKLIKYNVLLIFALLMVQGLVISYWDLFFHRQITTSVAQWIYGNDILIYTDRNLAIFFFLLTFLVFLATYIYLFFSATKGNFTSLPHMLWLTDSVAFWLRIKTPTMRFGSRKKKKGF